MWNRKRNQIGELERRVISLERRINEMEIYNLSMLIKSKDTNVSVFNGITQNCHSYKRYTLIEIIFYILKYLNIELIYINPEPSLSSKSIDDTHEEK
jgi:hypothetical protein